MNSALHLEKGLPSSVEAEQAVLGSVLLNNAVFAEASRLGDAAFCLEKHRILFRTFRDMSEQGVPIDYLTLVTWLEAKGQLEAIDGITYIASLTDGMPRFENIGSYVKIIQDRYRLRLLMTASHHAIARAYDLDDPDDVASKVIGDVAETLALGSRGESHSVRQLIETYPGGLASLLNPAKDEGGIPTGFLSLDNRMHGLRPSELTVIGGRPSMGKTAFALNIAENIMQRDEDASMAILMFSLEMSSTELVRRLLCSVARVDSHRFRGGFLNAEERQRLSAALGLIAKWQFFIDDSAQLDISDFYGRVRRFAMLHPLAAILVDYLQLMESKEHSKGGRTTEVSAISRRLKLVAKEFAVPVVALSQLSRAGEKRTGDNRPRLSDLRESGAIEQDADNVLFVHREEVYKRDREDLHGLGEIEIAKQRNGPIGRCKVAFVHKFAKFENLAEDVDGEEWETDDE